MQETILAQLTRQEKQKSKKVLWIARIIDSVTAFLGISTSIPTFGASFVLSELIESLPEIAYTLWRGYKQRQELRKMVSLIREINGINSPAEMQIKEFIKPQLWEDIIITKLLTKLNPSAIDTKLHSYIAENVEDNKTILANAAKHSLPILLKGTWKEVLDLIPVVNRVSMGERKYLKLLKSIV